MMKEDIFKQVPTLRTNTCQRYKKIPIMKSKVKKQCPDLDHTGILVKHYDIVIENSRCNNKTRPDIGHYLFYLNFFSTT